MKHTTIVRLGLLILVGCAPDQPALASEAADPGNPVEGVWRMVIEEDAAGVLNPSPQPSLYIFSPPYYSVARVNGTAARPMWPAAATRAQLTTAQVRSTFDPYTSNSGGFDVRGDTLIIRPIVALSPNFMNGGADTVTFRVSGDSLVLSDLLPGDGGSALSSARTTLIRLR